MAFIPHGNYVDGLFFYLDYSAVEFTLLSKRNWFHFNFSWQRPFYCIRRFLQAFDIRQYRNCRNWKWLSNWTNVMTSLIYILNDNYLSFISRNSISHLRLLYVWAQHLTHMPSIPNSLPPHLRLTLLEKAVKEIFRATSTRQDAHARPLMNH